MIIAEFFYNIKFISDVREKYFITVTLPVQERICLRGFILYYKIYYLFYISKYTGGFEYCRTKSDAPNPNP